MYYFKYFLFLLGCTILLSCEDKKDNASALPFAVTMVAAGSGADALGNITESHTCALLSSGKVKCWGGNNFGQLGLGDRNSRGDDPRDMGNNLSFVNLGAGRTAKYIATGALHSCAILDNNAVKCWGYNLYGQLGIENTDNMGDNINEMGDSLPVVNLGSGRTARALALGRWHSCALLDNNTVKCWGYNFNGELGQGDITLRGTFANSMGDNILPINLGTGRTAMSIASGSHHVCALLDDNNVKCWGYNLYGQLGKGNTTTLGDGPGEMGDSLINVDIGVGRTARAIAAGGDGMEGHTCVIRDDNTVSCWGRNLRGQLGIGDVFDRGDGPGEMGAALASLDFGLGRTAVQLRLGKNHSCAILDNSTLKCWGHNTYGELGLGNTGHVGDNAGEMGDSLNHVDLGAGLTATGVSLAAQTCAILNTGRLKCWGSNFTSALGLGDRVDRGGLSTDMGDALPTVEIGSQVPPDIN